MVIVALDSALQSLFFYIYLFLFFCFKVKRILGPPSTRHDEHDFFLSFVITSVFETSAVDQEIRDLVRLGVNVFCFDSVTYNKQNIKPAAGAVGFTRRARVFFFFFVF